MPQPVLRPLGKVRCFTNAAKLLPRANRSHVALHSGEWPQPCCEVWLDWNDPSPRALSFRSLDLNVSTHNINLVPSEAFYLSVSHACECSDCEHGDDVGSNAACGM